MHARRRRATLVCSSLLAAGLLAGVAVAGNPHGSSGNSSGGNSSGVKPSSTTQHDTHATAGSNQTKQYGNGKTAGQIAMNNGASSSTDLYGPGNSQPHKVAVCSKNGKTHYVDVHALKSHGAGSCTSTSTSSSTSQSASANTAGVSNTSGSAGVSAATNTSSSTGTPASTPSPSTSTKSGVLGAAHTQSKPVAAHSKPAHAVLGAASFTG